MSDDYLRLIPLQPQFVPTAVAGELARSRFADLVPDAEEVTAVITEEVEFIDQGANFERVRCPNCGAELDKEWWQGRMDEAAAAAFSALDVAVPCCGLGVSLNDLSYELPAGFAKFVLEALNPNVRDLPEIGLAEIAAALGTPLRKIWAHY